ncbi:polysaccharide biosynthesis/export family protein [Pseudocolwellia agarivorans]|jgi:polysaccharide export outer membrane protein|uniref:polysaccharide biosynthesis/export family protein n=1 Tax=Pseudocolwellia agarivorans TaxID=1911682 RepID=UPI003F884777
MRCLIFLLLFSPFVLANNYKLGSGDKIQIIVYGEEDLTTEITIDKSGVISFPFLKDIQVVDLSVKELERVIYQGLLGDYLISPQVSVSVVQYRPFYIHGQVNRPGGYPYQENLTFDKAIAVAGGLSIRASKSDWEITRKVNGEVVTIEANVATQIMPDDIIKIEQSFF